MSLHNYVKSFAPKGFLWKLTLLNTVVIIAAIALSSWAVYNTACFLAEGIGNFDEQRQQQFNGTLLQYLLIFSMIGIIAGGLLHFYMTKKIVGPIRKLIASTEKLKQGEYPQKITVGTDDEVGQLIKQYNGLIQQLQANEQERHRLVSDVSHELRTPLSNLSGYLQALKTGMIQGNETLFHALHDEANRLSQLVEQLELLKEWDHSGTDKFANKQSVAMSTQINQCVSLFDWKLKELDIPVEVNAVAAPVKVQVEALQQVLHNLLDNAIRYYEGNGPITITGEKERAKYRISFTGPSKTIPQADQANIFDRFYRIESSRDRQTGGSGLGLAIVREVVKKHNGQVGVDSKEGTTTFWVSFPVEG
ncbi:sensor histidine kinase [Virgibacillus sp. W0181]|uniref:sensor histidine kinase n=1 Tax=Virgibacillus sp. W0181 TaxID=3391581 RepID=UPI003F472989